MDYFQLTYNRNRILDLLTERKALIEQFIGEMKRKNRKKPEAELRSTNCRKYPQYYIRNASGARWQYLPKERWDEAAQIANYEFREDLLCRAYEDLSAVKTFLSKSGPTDYNEVYERLLPGRKRLVNRLYDTDEQYRQTFLSEDFDSYQSYIKDKKFETQQGDSVRSKSEWMIAETLARYNIPYQYEYPLYLEGLGIVHPDFRCLNMRTREVYYWEHRGKMDDPEYAARAAYKLQIYGANGFYIGENLIMTEETLDCPLRPEIIERMVKRKLM